MLGGRIESGRRKERMQLEGMYVKKKVEVREEQGGGREGASTALEETNMQTICGRKGGY